MRTAVLLALFGVLLTACGGGGMAPVAAVSSNASPSSTTDTSDSESPGQGSGVPIPAGQIDRAVSQLDAMAADIMARTGIPGMAVAVVHGGQTVYAKGFGVRAAGNPALVDADTVFQLASMSKSIGATVVAQQVGAGRVKWDTPVQANLPSFSLADPYISEKMTIGDLYSHRSGLPSHAGDKLEDLGYDRTQVLNRLRYSPLTPFRVTYAYTNFGLTAAAESVAIAAGVDWATLSEQSIYHPLGMNSTSSRFADYQARPNRAVGHVKVNGSFVVGVAREPDAQSPAGGVTSSVNDVAKWLAFLLANGSVGGRQLVDASALQPATSPQIVSIPSSSMDERSGFYGYGFNVSTSAAGRMMISHSGAFALGAATAFTAIPSADVAIVVLTNAAPYGIPETLTAQFADLVQFGRMERDWEAFFTKAFAPFLTPEGSLVGVAKPVSPAPAKVLSSYVGIYQNDYYGPLQVVNNQGSLELRLGPKPMTYPLSHWDGDVFTFTLNNENAPPGTISKASFSSGKVVLEYFDDGGLGTFVR
ncbi:serine hydrolase [Noviherbaspirillum cavernae]|uniref:Serine hydrolase n=1 Tax=Noviherbaspirillum cavernae TaxID=2320862 RepID=A0A418X628_9BURK|nr:serine hydrolase [Noviherbaspirillum cavernae]RJG07943.1 serine hydrolase [Noviherbaspirillum cavernae]